jgi:acetate kinase
MSQSHAILVINAGSSSLKYSLFSVTENQPPELQLVYHGNIAGIGTQPHFIVNDVQGRCLVKQDLGTADHARAFAIFLEWMEKREDGLELAVVGHRVVHGGGIFTAPVQISATILEQLEQLIPLAPLHQPHNIAPIKILHKLKPDLLQVACFDSAFHSTQPKVAQQFALPRELTAQGLKRYGFHGLSYEYIAQILPQFAGEMPERTIVAHLGNGVSLCALKHGLSVATTMGFTALDGVPMGTRPGALDPGVLLYLLDQGMDTATLTQLLYHQSGLLGVSGISNDMRTLLASDSPHATEAIELFVYRIGRELGSLTAALGGLDALVFTAGIGQYAAPIRTGICQQAEWLGVKIDIQANEQHQINISHPDSQVAVWVIPTDEEKMIALHSCFFAF